jgi:hypothetical protein
LFCLYQDWSEIPHIGLDVLKLLSLDTARGEVYLSEFRLVCKGWLLEHDQFALRLNLTPELRQITIEEMRFFLARFPSAQDISVCDSHTLYALYAIYPRDDCPMWSKALDGLNPTKIRTLSIRNLGNSNLGDSDCLTALIGFTALTELNLYGPRCAALDLRALEGLTALKTIDLSGTQSMLRDDEFISLAGLTNLTNLNLANCRKLSNRGFATLTCFTALTRLDLTGTRVNDEVILNHLTKLTALTWLVVSTQNYVPYYGPRISTGVIQQLALKLPDMVLISAPLPTVDQI